MLAILLSVAIGLATSFVGSFLCFVLWMHFHLEELWSERHARIELERMHRRIDNMSDEEILAMEGKPQLRLVIDDGEEQVS